jgi:DNA-3-methyladenine glycosylase II
MKKLTYQRDSKEIQVLIEQDPTLKQLFDLKSEITVDVDDNYFVSLVGTIISQQLSSKVARVLFTRLYTQCKNNITPEKIRDMLPETMRSMGLSYQKQSYLKSLAECMLNKTVIFDHIHHMTNQEVIDMLIQIKGIGVWSAEMFLMFSLGREDVFSVGDLGLRNAIKKLYNAPDLTHQDILKISESWQPYRSIVSHYLWHAWDSQ